MHHLLHEVHPHEVLDKVFKLLTPNGKILIGDIIFFYWYEHHHVFWNRDSIKTLFDPDIFEVNSIPYTEKVRNRDYESFFAEVFLKRGTSYPDVSELLPRIKTIYRKMLGCCRIKIDKMGGPYSRKEIPDEVRVYCDLESHIKRRLENLDDLPEMKTVMAIDSLMKELQEKYYKWQGKYIQQEGKCAHKGILPPHEFLELTQLKRLREKEELPNHEERSEREEFRKMDSAPLLEIIQKPINRRLVLLGDPGIGKTTTLEYLCRYHAENFKIFKTIPVHIPLKYYTKENNWLLSQIGLSLNGLNIHEVTKVYHVILLLDGYNEVRNENLQFLDSEINDLLKMSATFGVVITSRKTTCPQYDGFNTCEIEPLDDTRIKLYLTHTFGQKLSPAVFSDVVKKELIGLARVFLFLDFICDLSQRPGNEPLPDTKGGLLERMIEIKYTNRPEEKLQRYRVPVDLIISLLSEFCYKLARRNSGIGFEREELRYFIASKRKWISDNFEDFNASDVVNEIREHGFVEDHFTMFSFWHQAIFEYLVARHLKRILESQTDNEEALLTIFIDHFRYKKWDAILSIFFDLIDKTLKEKLLKCFSIKEDERRVDRISLLIDISKLARLTQPCIGLSKNQSSSIRSEAADALGEMKSPEAVKPLIGLLKDEDSSVRLYAEHGLGMIKSPQAIKPLVELLKDETSSVRDSVAHILGEIKSPEAVEPLLELMKDENSSVRRSAARAQLVVMNEFNEEEILNVCTKFINAIKGSSHDCLYYYQALKQIRYIPEDFSK
jgi:hypothetical protein